MVTKTKKGMGVELILGRNELGVWGGGEGWRGAGPDGLKTPKVEK